MHLRDWDVDFDALTSRRLATHKTPIIREIMMLHPTLPFILIGDDSQHDPEIYRALLDEFPGRIPAIYIRNVKEGFERSESLRRLAEEVHLAGSALIVAPDTLAAATHAVGRGWIAPEALDAIREEKSGGAPSV
jgi:phosphatidate phosphatase APP1